MPEAFADRGTLYFFFDYISHNAYLAWQRVPALAKKHGLEFEPVPVLFAAMLNHHKQVGPGELPPKRDWMLRNVLRKARLLGVPLNPPHTHPFNPLWPLRVSHTPLARESRFALIDALFKATWAQSRAVSEPAVVKEVVAECGLPAELPERAQDESVKAALREATDAALARGVFGVPTMLVRGEVFWGYDDLPYLEMFLDGKDVLPQDRALFERWAAVRPSAERRK